MGEAWQAHGSTKRAQIIGNNSMCCQFIRERPPANNRPFETDGWWLVGRSKCGTLTHLDQRVKRSRTTELQTTGHRRTYCDERIVTLVIISGRFDPAFTGKKEVLTVCVFQPINIGVWNNSSEKEPVEGPGICILRGTGRVRPREIGRKDPGYAFSPFNRTQ